MPVYHSSLNEQKCQLTCKSAILPLKTKCKGPAPSCGSDKVDIIDEAIDFFRANVLYRTYDQPGPADLVICYLTIYISEILRHCSNAKTRNDCEKVITQLSMSGNFQIPGDPKFPLAGFFGNPADRRDADAFRNYYRQLREETAKRMVPIMYTEDGSKQNKWWFQFAKRKFMNIAKT